MKKEVILVPKDKCPIDVLAEMGERIRKSWIFLHANAYEHLLESRGVSYSTFDNMNAAQNTLIKLEATAIRPETDIFCEVPSRNGWGKITRINASDIPYGIPPSDPEDIFFLKMEK